MYIIWLIINWLENIVFFALEESVCVMQKKEDGENKRCSVWILQATWIESLIWLLQPWICTNNVFMLQTTVESHFVKFSYEWTIFLIPTKHSFVLCQY